MQKMAAKRYLSNRQVWPGLQNEAVTIVVQWLIHVWLIATQWTAACQASPSFTISQSFLKLMSFELVMPSNHLILSFFFSCLLSFPAIMSFPMSQLFISTGQSIGASASASVFKDYSGLVSFSIDWLVWSPWNPWNFEESSPTSQFKMKQSKD